MNTREIKLYYDRPATTSNRIINPDAFKILSNDTNILFVEGIAAVNAKAVSKTNPKKNYSVAVIIDTDKNEIPFKDLATGDISSLRCTFSNTAIRRYGTSDFIVTYTRKRVPNQSPIGNRHYRINIKNRTVTVINDNLGVEYKDIDDTGFISISNNKDFKTLYSVLDGKIIGTYASIEKIETSGNFLVSQKVAVSNGTISIEDDLNYIIDREGNIVSKYIVSGRYPEERFETTFFNLEDYKDRLRFCLENYKNQINNLRKY